MNEHTCPGISGIPPARLPKPKANTLFQKIAPVRSRVVRRAGEEQDAHGRESSRAEVERGDGNTVTLQEPNPTTAGLAKPRSSHYTARAKENSEFQSVRH